MIIRTANGRRVIGDSAHQTTASNWLELAEQVAKACHGGHLSLLRFTGGWVAVFGTPDTTYGGDDYGYLTTLRHADSPDQACRALLLRDRYLTASEAPNFYFEWQTRAWIADEQRAKERRAAEAKAKADNNKRVIVATATPVTGEFKEWLDQQPKDDNRTGAQS